MSEVFLSSWNVLKWLGLTLYLHSPFFAVLHVIVALLVLWDLKHVYDERKACLEWPIIPQTDASLRIADQLHFFQKESERWRHRGVVIPMTDFSDRIDSTIEGSADQLHNRVNLFLIVGIAGTFFGMASFGRELLLPGPNGLEPSAVSRALVAAIANSFPVGFAGLILSLVFHPVVSHAEQQLRDAAREAVNRAIVGRSLELQNAEETQITESLRPVLDSLKGLLEQGQKQWIENSAGLKAQNQQMIDSFGGLASAITGLGEPVRDLTSRLGAAAVIVEDVSKLSRGALEQSTRAIAAAEQLQQGIQGTLDVLGKTAEEFRALPEQVREGLETSFGDFSGHAVSNVREVTETFYSSIAGAVVTALSQIEAKSRDAGEKLVEASGKLNEVAATFGPTLKEAFQQSADNLRRPLEDFDKTFREHYPDAIRELGQTLASSLDKLVEVKLMLEAIGKAGERTEKSVQAWGRLETAVTKTESGLSSVARELYRTAQTLEQTLKPPKRGILERLFGQRA